MDDGGGELPASVDLNGAAGAWLWDVETNRLYGDRRYAALCALDPIDASEGLPAESFFSGVHPDDLLKLRIAVAGVLHGSERLNRLYRVCGRDGRIRWVNARASAVHDSEGRPLRFGGLLLDVTEQRRLEDRLRVAQTAGGVGSFEVVPDFATAQVSEQFCRLLGLQPTDAVAIRTINSLVHPSDPPLIPRPAGAPGRAPDVELRIVRPDDGQERWLARRGEHLRDEDAGLRFVGAVFDITALKRAEEKLRELARTLEQRVEARTQERDRLWNISQDLLAVLEPSGDFRAANPAWARALGHDPEALVGERLTALLAPEDAGAFSNALSALQSDRAPQEVLTRVRSAEGEDRFVNWSLIAADGAVFATGRDETERRQLEDQLRQAQKMEAVGQLTGGLAHDFNNMLTGVIGGMAIVRRRIAAGRAGEAEPFIHAAVASAERAAALTQRLLAFSRRQTLDPQAVDANALIRSVEDLLRRTLGEQTAFQAVCAEGLWTTLCDPNQLESALLNLAINARDAMPRGGTLTIETANARLERGFAKQVSGGQPGDYVAISVSDTGVGMSSEVLAKVFDPFFTTKPIGHGTGLGLSMVHGFVRQSGGDVTIASEPGLGTTVRLYLPRLVGAAEAQGPAELAREAHEGGGERILLVEDDESVRMLVHEVLAELGYNVMDAADGREALRVLESAEPLDLLITDVGLPGVSGRELADLARKHRRALPVLFITGYAANAANRSDFLAPGMDMISKPFAFEALAERVQSLLQQAARNALQSGLGGNNAAPSPGI